MSQQDALTQILSMMGQQPQQQTPQQNLPALMQLLPSMNTPANDPNFQAWFKQHNNGGWDPVDSNGMSGGYNLYQAYKLGLKPNKDGHLPDTYAGYRLKGDDDTRAVMRGIDGRTGVQVADPSYTGPMTDAIKKNQSKYWYAKTAKMSKKAGWERDGSAIIPPKNWDGTSPLED